LPIKARECDDHQLGDIVAFGTSLACDIRPLFEMDVWGIASLITTWSRPWVEMRTFPKLMARSSTAACSRTPLKQR